MKVTFSYKIWGLQLIMKRVNNMLMIANFLIFIIFGLNACTTSSTHESSDISIYPTENNKDMTTPTPSAQDMVLSMMKPWQIDYVKNNNLLNNSLLLQYPDQKGMLEDIGYSTIETPEETALLDKYHEINGWWFLMRENMTIVYSEEHNDKNYGIILTVGGEGCNGLHVVSYTARQDGAINILEHVSGDNPISSGFYPNVKSIDNENIFFGLTKSTRYDPSTDKTVPADFAKIDIIQSDGEIISQSITSDNTAILHFFPKTIELASCRLLNEDDHVIETYDLSGDE